MFQHNLISAIRLKERISNCLAERCAAMTQAAEQVSEAEREKRAALGKAAFEDYQAYREARYFGLARALVVEEADLCVLTCQRPAQVAKRVLSQNFQELQENIQQCAAKFERTSGGVKEVDYAGVERCLETNLQLMKAVERDLTSEFVAMSDKLFI